MCKRDFSFLHQFFKDHPERLKKAENAFKSGRVLFVQVQPGGMIMGKVQASMKQRSYRVELQVSEQMVTFSSCECPVGQDRCHHMAALLLWIQKNVSRTDLECKWSRPKPCKSQETPTKRLSQLTPSTSTAGIKRLVEEEDREWLLQRVSLLGRFTGIGWILSKEPEVVKQVKSYAFITSTPEFEHAPDKVEYVVEHMAVSEEDVKVIERTNVGQRHNALWFAYKQNRLTSSNFGAVLGAVRRNSTPPSLLKTLRGEYGSAGRSSAIQWGVNHEDIALEKYSALSGCDVQPTGLFIMDNGQLGASPDGQVSKDLIVEVKCPWSARATSLIELAMKKDFFLFNDPTAAPGMLKLKETHKYWHQVQGALHITGATACDFFVWTPMEYHCIRIQKDPKWASNIPILTQFHRKILLPTVLGS